MINKLSQKSTQIFLFDIIQIGLLMSLSGAALSKSTIQSIGVWMMFTAIICMALFEIFVCKEGGISAVLILLIIPLAIISMLYSDQLSFQNIVNLLSFLEIPLIIAFVKPLDTDRRIKSACLFSFLISLMYVYCYYQPVAFARETEYGRRILDELHLGYSNPNETGMHLASTLYVLVAAVFFEKKKMFRIVLVIMATVVAFFVVKTKSRASILMLIFFAALIIPVVRWKKIPPIVQKILFLSPLLTLLTILLIPGILSSQMLLGEMVDTGRIAIILSRYNSLNFVEWLIGDYSYKFENSLNAYLSVLLTVGLIALCAFFVIIKCGIENCSARATKNYNKIAFVGVLLFITHASVESANLVAGSFYAASFISVYVITIDNGGSGWLDDYQNRKKTKLNTSSYKNFVVR